MTYQVKTEQTISKIIKGVRTLKDLKEIFNLAVNEIGSLIEVDSVKISQYIPEKNVWLTVSDYRSRQELPSCVGTYLFRKGDKVNLQLKQINDILCIDNTNIYDNEFTRKIAQYSPGAWLILPIHFDSKIWGNLCLTSNSRLHYWQKDKIELVSMILDLLVIAIEKHQYYQTIQALIEQDIYQELEETKQLCETKSQLLALTTHEICNPLAAIMSSAELLRLYNEPNNEEKKLMHLQRIETAILRIRQIVQDVITLAESQSEKEEISVSEVNPVQLCQEIINTLTQDYTNSNRIEFTVSNQNMQNAFINLTIVRHVVTNLLENSLKYSPQEKTVKLDLSQYENQFIFRIQDQGIGIPQEDVNNIFQPFYRCKNVGERTGSGLGLSIVRQYIDLHKGNIAVDSTLGQGTTFTVALPSLPLLINSDTN